MKPRALIHFALAETRRSRGTLLFCVLSIAIGVMSLTAVRSVMLGLQDNLEGQARNIAGADLTLEAKDPLTGEAATAITDDLLARGAQATDYTAFYSMLTRVGDANGGPAAKATRLVRVRAIEKDYPFYGKIPTEPPGQLDALAAAPRIVVDPVVMRELGLTAGDRVALGEQDFEVAGSVAPKPGSPASGFSLAPGAYIAQRYLDDTELLQTGSRVNYFRLFRTPAGLDVDAWKNSQWDRALDANIEIRTARESAARIDRFLERLSNFLTLVGLITLLLGALGIGSAMNVFIRGKLDNAAVFRCLGARPRDVFAMYGTVALLVGGVGSAAGVVAGAIAPMAIAPLAERVATGLLPTELTFGFEPRAMLHGLLAGVAATLVFALLPVYRIGRVSPLRVMRRRADPIGTPRRARDLLVYAAVALALFGFILVLAIVETSSTRVAVYFTAAIAASLVLLAGVARLAMLGARLLIPRLRRYHLKQGLANLYRPGNQTASVITAVGVGILLIGTIFIVEASIQQTIAIESRDELPNVFIIDIQSEQRDGVEQILTRPDVTHLEIAPMVAARIAGVNGRSVDRSTVERDAKRRTWQDRMRTREYFLSYRDYTVDSEEVVAGELWEGTPPTQEASIDLGLAENLGIALGDTLTLDVQGIPIDTTVTSFREIRWQAMRPNAMILLSPGEIEQAPKMFVSSFRLPDEQARYAVQERLVREYPNLTVIDITDTAETVRFLIGRISMIMGFLALITVASGAIILGGAIAAGRFARQRESMLLKVLGASRRDLRRILVSEYAALASLGALAGCLLAIAITRPALTLFFEAPPVVPYGAITGVAAAVIALNVLVGALIGRGVSRGKPLDVLREE